jgi:hypothetical protein
MRCGSEEGSYLRLVDFVHHSTLGLSVIKKKRRCRGSHLGAILLVEVLDGVERRH